MSVANSVLKINAATDMLTTERRWGHEKNDFSFFFHVGKCHLFELGNGMSFEFVEPLRGGVVGKYAAIPKVYPFLPCSWHRCDAGIDIDAPHK